MALLILSNEKKRVKFIDSSLLLFRILWHCISTSIEAPMPHWDKVKRIEKWVKRIEWLDSTETTEILLLVYNFFYIYMKCFFFYVDATPLVMEFILEYFLFALHFPLRRTAATFVKCGEISYIIWLLLDAHKVNSSVVPCSLRLNFIRYCHGKPQKCLFK